MEGIRSNMKTKSLERVNIVIDRYILEKKQFALALEQRIQIVFVNHS